MSKYFEDVGYDRTILIKTKITIWFLFLSGHNLQTSAQGKKKEM